MRNRMVARYNRMKADGCEYPDSFTYDDIDFETVNDVCTVSFSS